MCGADCNGPQHHKVARWDKNERLWLCAECAKSAAESRMNERYWQRLEAHACKEEP